MRGRTQVWGHPQGSPPPDQWGGASDIVVTVVFLLVQGVVVGLGLSRELGWYLELPLTPQVHTIGNIHIQASTYIYTVPCPRCVFRDQSRLFVVTQQVVGL